MLRMILDALEELSQTQSEQQRTNVTDVGTNVGINVGTNEEKLLLLLKQDGTLTAKVLAGTLGITQRQVERMIARWKKECSYWLVQTMSKCFILLMPSMLLPHQNNALQPGRGQCALPQAWQQLFLCWAAPCGR